MSHLWGRPHGAGVGRSDGRGYICEMRNRRGLLALSLLMVAFGAAACSPWWEDDALPPVACWDIVIPGDGMEPLSPMLIDKCEGETWLLVHSTITGNPSDGYRFSWQRLLVEDTPVLLVPRGR